MDANQIINAVFDDEIFDNENIACEKTLKKKESNKKYYLRHAETHKEHMKRYYDEHVKDKRYWCPVCNCYVLNVNRNHKYCKKHVKILENVNVNNENVPEVFIEIPENL